MLLAAARPRHFIYLLSLQFKMTYLYNYCLLLCWCVLGDCFGVFWGDEGFYLVGWVFLFVWVISFVLVLFVCCAFIKEKEGEENKGLPASITNCS